MCWLRIASKVSRAFSGSQSHHRTPPPTTSTPGCRASTFSNPFLRPWAPLWALRPPMWITLPLPPILSTR